MPRRKIKRVHRVTGNVNLGELVKAGNSLNLFVHRGNEKLGTIIIGQGSFSWMGKKRRHEKEWSWSAFAKLMNREAYGE
jgi:hypothetical protein